MDDLELTSIRSRAASASAGPWFVRVLDDDYAMNLVAISTVADSGHERWPDFDSGEIVAATLVQQPRYVSQSDSRWDENAEFIAHAREDVPRLLEEVARLRALLDPASPSKT